MSDHHHFYPIDSPVWAPLRSEDFLWGVIRVVEDIRKTGIFLPSQEDWLATICHIINRMSIDKPTRYRLTVEMHKAIQHAKFDVDIPALENTDLIYMIETVIHSVSGHVQTFRRIPYMAPAKPKAFPITSRHRIALEPI